jgi:beta-galactosidase
MKALRDKYDPYGGRAAGSREMLSKALQQAAEYGGEMLFINKSARNPMWAMEYSRDEGARKFWDAYSPPFHKEGEGPLHKGQPAAAYNHNQDAHAIENVRRWTDYWRERPGTGTRVSSGGVNIVLSDTNTHYRGAENYRRSGEVDAMRIPKEGFFAHQVIWDGWVDVERPRAHILGHWNYAPGTVKPVTVVSSAERVELYLNGRKLGSRRQDEPFLFTFEDVRWEAGRLEAIGYDAQGRRICNAAVATAGAGTRLKLSAITAPDGMRADGADLALVQAEVVDALGRRNPVALDTVHFTLSGPAEWRGGIAQGPGNHVLDRSLPLEAGVNRVLIRSGTRAGKITVRASADGLAPAELSLVSKPCAVEGGLARRLPGDDLPASLQRGPTPATPSFALSRVALPVASVEASSNGREAGNSVDDDETTRWTSQEGDPRPAITFKLARRAPVKEVVLKLGGWRERRYPLLIEVDGKPVYRGITPTSYGYVTLRLDANEGGELRIRLEGAGSESLAAAPTEVANQKTVDTGAKQISRDALAIVEAEFYTAP